MVRRSSSVSGADALAILEQYRCQHVETRTLNPDSRTVMVGGVSNRAIFEPEHESFREAVGAFLDKEVVPFHEQWEADGVCDREVWKKAGAQGLLALQLPEEYGGGGTDDFRYNVVIGEEMTRRGVYGAAFPLFNDMIVPYLVASTNEEQRRRWFPGLCSGEQIAAIAMTEPGAGSDRQGIRTTAVAAGDHYLLN